MPVSYRINVLEALKAAGYSTYRIRKEKIFSESTLQMFRNKEPVSWAVISKLCDLLQCDVGDILTNVE